MSWWVAGSVAGASRKRIVGGVALSLVVLLATSTLASAQNLVRLDPPVSLAIHPTTATVQLEIDFSDPTLGGGVVVDYPAGMLYFESFTFDGAFPDDPDLRLVCPSAHPGCAFFPGPGVLIAFAVDTFSFPAISGAHTVGALRFETLDAGSALLDLSEDDSVAGPFVGSGAFAPPTIADASLLVRLTTVPVPSMTWPGWLALAGALAIAASRTLARTAAGSH